MPLTTRARSPEAAPRESLAALVGSDSRFGGGSAQRSSPRTARRQAARIPDHGRVREGVSLEVATTDEHVRANTHHSVRQPRCRARDRSDALRLQALLQLDGVSVPTASAILTLLDPRRYGVIDIRVWRLLHSVGAVTGNREGRNLTPAQWLEFLSILRPLSSRLGVTVREVELALFNVQKARQKGRLYDGLGKGSRS